MNDLLYYDGDIIIWLAEWNVGQRKGTLRKLFSARTLKRMPTTKTRILKRIIRKVNATTVQQKKGWLLQQRRQKKKGTEKNEAKA